MRYHPGLLSGNDKGIVMAQSTAKRPRTHRRPVRGSVRRIDVEIPVEVAATLGYLAHPWGGTRWAAFARLLMDAWERESRPMPGYDEDDHPLPGH
jgi:hypothetical protein